PPTNKQGRRRTHDNPHLYICGSGLQPRTETIFPLPSRERAGEREQHIPLHRESPLPLPLGEGPGEREQTSPSPPRKPAPSPLAGEGWGEGETEHFSLFLKGGPDRDVKTPPQHETPSPLPRESREGNAGPTPATHP